MRILQFCNYADRIGGAEVYAHALTEALRERGHEVSLFGASPEGEVDRRGLRVIQRPVNDRSRLVIDPPALNAVMEYIHRFRPEVIHAHNLFSVALEVIEYLGRCGVPLMQTVHDFQLLCPNSWCVHGDGAPCRGGAGAHCFEHDCQRNDPYDSWSVLLAAFRQRLVSSGTGIAIAPSSYLVERLRANGWTDVRRVPNFVEFTPLPDGSREGCELLYVGRLEKEKGVAVLIEAMPEIVAAVPSAHLTVVGSGSEHGRLQERAKSVRASAAVRFLKQAPRSQLCEFYARSSLCVIPSIWTENSPLVAHECLLSGLPMVGSRIGGLPELIEPDCGFTFVPRDPQDLARAVIRYLRLPRADRQRMSAAARERSLSFGRREHVEQVEKLYEELRSRPSGTTSPVDGLTAFFPLLQKVGADRPSQEPTTPMQRIRELARTLGLPKLLS